MQCRVKREEIEKNSLMHVTWEMQAPYLAGTQMNNTTTGLQVEEPKFQKQNTKRTYTERGEQENVQSDKEEAFPPTASVLLSCSVHPVLTAFQRETLFSSLWGLAGGWRDRSYSQALCVSEGK